MKNLLKRILESKNIVEEAKHINNSLSDDDKPIANSVRVLVYLQSDGCHPDYGNHKAKDTYSLFAPRARDMMKLEMPTIVKWPQLLELNASHGLCVLKEGTALYFEKDNRLLMMGKLSEPQMHRVIGRAMSVSLDAYKWKYMSDNNLVDVTNSETAFCRNPFFANRNINRLSVVDIASISSSPIIARADKEVSIRVGDRVIETACPQFIAASSNAVLTNEDGLILRSARQDFL